MSRVHLRGHGLLIGAIALCLAVLAALVYQQPLMQSGLNIYDEGIILVGAARVMRGELPYRDFWTQYSPGQFYTLAALFSITGKSVMVARWWDVLTRALLATALYLLAARAAGWRRALLVWPLAVLWLTYYGFYAYPIFQGLLFSCLALYAYLCGLGVSAAPGNSGSSRWMAAAGVAFGAAFAFRHDMSAYLGVAIALTSAAHAIANGLRLTDLLRQLRPMVLTAALVIVPVTAYFALQVAPGELLQQLLIFPLIEFPKYRDLPYPKLSGEPSDLPFYAPFAIYALVATRAILRLRRGETERSQALAMLGMALFGVFGFNQARVRSDLIHTVHFFMLALALLPALWPARKSLSGALSVPRFALGMLSATLMLAALLDPLDAYTTHLRRRDPVALAKRAEASPPVARGIPLDDWQQSMLAGMRFYAKPEDTAYIGLTRHDKVFANDVMSYFLFDRPVPTRYHEIHPGIVDTVAVQNNMIADLERSKPYLLFLTNMFDGAQEPNLSNKSTNVKLLDAYLKQHYRAFSTAGPFTIYKLREAKR